MNNISHENSSFYNMLLKESNNIGIKLNNEQIVKFEKYKNLLVSWNEKINLTAITDDEGIVLKHFIDCLEIVKYIDEGKKIIDVGTGAGFPGIVIAIFFNGKVEVTLIDALNKRINFLQEVIKELELKNVIVEHARAEEIGSKENCREKYDYAVSRAVAPLNVLLEFDTPFLKIGGKCLLLKGSNIEEEIKLSKNALNVLNCKINNKYKYCYTYNNEIYNRYVVEIIKNDKTSLKYPRIYGKIKKNPL